MTALTITASGGSMTYGGTVPTITPSYSGFVNGDTAASLSAQPQCTTAATASSPVGSYASSCSGGADSNYTISYVPGKVTVTPANLTITASSASTLSGQAPPAITPVYSGLVNGNTAASLSAQPQCSTTATASSPVGTYPSSCSGAADSNYAITYTAGTVTVNPEVFADASALGALITKDQFGVNMNAGFDITNPPSQAATLSGIGIGLLRWPGGSPADWYHWQTNTWSASPCSTGGSPNANSTFDDFEQTLVVAGTFDVAVTLNYGSNPACNGPADPNEAAQWVAYAKQHGYTAKYWTVGNEVYGSGEIDLHSPGAHDPTTYANNVATQFYPLIKAQDATALVGVVLDGGNYTSNNWDSIVLANAKYDFVEIHYYPENPGSESDSLLLTQGPQRFAATFAKVRQELVAAGHPNMPILLGEYNSPNYSPGKQTMSIVNALFVGMVQGEIMKAGITLATVEDGYFGECNDSGNNSSTLYGWQNFGSYALFAGTVPNCSGAIGIPADTPFPIARAFGLSSQFGAPGNRVIGVQVSTALPNVRAYAAQQGSGYALMLFNLDESNAATITLGIASAPAKPYAGTVATYDKALYDQSASGVWAAPSTQSLGTFTLPLTVNLQPWSMSVITLQ